MARVTDLDELAQAIGGSFSLTAGRPRMDDADFLAHLEALNGLDASRRARVAEDLVVLAQRAWNTGQDAWSDAIVQLCALIGAALGSGHAAARALESTFGADQARALVGAASSLRPVGSGPRPAGAVSPLAARLDGRGKKSKARSKRDKS